jgi:uncharacterized secreted repeat protein (TIGR03808 family)
MPVDRRVLLGVGLGAGLAATAQEAAARQPGAARAGGPAAMPAAEAGLEPDAVRDQTDRLQRAIDQAAARGVPLILAPGQYPVRGVQLRSGSRLFGSPGATVLRSLGGGLLQASGARDVRIEGLVLDGDLRPLGTSRGDGLVMLDGCTGATLSDLDVRDSLANGIVLVGCSGKVAGCRIERVGEAAILSTDAAGLEISGNRITDCANNGILVWRSTPGEDGTIVAGNRIERIGAMAGGSGQHGNGINVFRAGGVLVTGNRISECAFSAIRGNAASNIQMTSNSCARLGEVALYAEFAFEGALIASNLVDAAATGISVTNFNEGGRLAVVQGNLVRNLVRRLHEPVDKRGDGICVEADAVVTGNTIENAPASGIMIGWGRWMRNVNVGANLVRNARIGIAISSDAAAGHVLVAQNMLAGCRDGAVRAVERGVPHGPDLARTPIDSARVSVTGNVVA